MKRTAAILSFLAAAAVAHAQGGPPMITEDPGTPGDGNWEINLALAMEQMRGERLFEAPILDVNYGAGDSVQLKYEVPWVFLDEEGDDATSGLGNSEFGVKWRIVDQEESGLDVSIYPQLEFENPTGSRRRGLIDPGVRLAMPFQLARRFGDWEASFEVSYTLVEEDEDE